MSLNRYLFSLVLVITSYGVIAASNNTHRIEFKHFSFSAPNTDKWEQVEMTSYQAIYSTRYDKTMYLINLLENVILNPKIKALTAKEVADDFIDHEILGMMEFCVKRGLYVFRDFTRSDEQISGKTFYTMKYSAIHPQVFQVARLYLYFPFEKDNNYFLVAHYCEAAPDQSSLKHSYEADFIQLLETLTHHDEE